MMIKSTSFLLRFVIAAILATGIGVRAFAHESPSAELRNETFAQGCFENQLSVDLWKNTGGDGNRSKGDRKRGSRMAPLTSSYSAAADLLVAVANECRTLGMTHGLLRNYLGNAAQHVSGLWDGAPTETPERLVGHPAIHINAPDKGLPPSPQLGVAPHGQPIAPVYVRSKKQFTEDYLPYDLAIRDWRVGFSYNKPSTPAAAVVVLEEPKLSPAEVTKWFADVANSIDRRVLKPELLTQWTEFVVSSLGHQKQQLLGGFATALTAWHREPFFAAPNFVLHEMPDGSKYLFTRQQAEAYNLSITQFDSPTYKSEETASRLSGCPVFGAVSDLVSSAIQRIEKSWTAATSNMDYLAGWFDNFSAAEMAGRSTETLR